MHITGIIAAGLVLLTPGLGNAWRADNRHEANVVSDTVFEVIGMPGSGPTQFWCGAGDYARTVLGVAANRRIYVWRGRGDSVTRPGKTSVQFAFSPAPGSENYQPGLSLDISQAGDHLNAAAASQYCHDIDRDEIWPRRP